MESLRLFPPELLEPMSKPASAPGPVEELVGPVEERARLIPAEYLQVAESFLEEGADRQGPLASIQAAIFLCEGAGDVSAGTLGALRIDSQAFPRVAAAVEWTRGWLERAPGQWPEGFWPRFLLGLLAGEHPA